MPDILKYKIDDTVYFLCGYKILKGTIKKVSYTAEEKFDYTINETITKTDISYEVRNIERSLHILTQENIFSSKKELINSLEEQEE